MDRSKIREMMELKDKCKVMLNRKAEKEGELKQMKKRLEEIGVKDIKELEDKRDEYREELDEIEAEMEEIYEEAMEALGE